MQENGDAAPNRFLVKFSGEYLAGEGGSGFSAERLAAVSRELKRAQRSANGVAVVVGGGNFFRGGRTLPTSIGRVTGDQIGMLATAMNALALRDAVFIGVDLVVQPLPEVASSASSWGSSGRGSSRRGLRMIQLPAFLAIV